jgi:DNA-directed RNA polymerase I subunit RPA1
MADFFRRCIAKKRCENCTGVSPPIRKDGVAKIFQMPLNKKTQMIMDAKGLKIQDVLVKAKASSESMDIDVSGNTANGVSGSESSSGDSSDEEESAKMPKGKISKEDGEAPAGQQKYMTPHQIRDHMTCLFDSEPSATTLMYGARNPRSPNLVKPVKASMFFIDVLAVAPTRFRPASVMGDKSFESPQNVLLGKILSSSQQVRESNARVQALGKNKEENREEIARAFNYLVNNIIKLQHDVNSFIDSTKNPAPLRQGQLPPAGIRQTLEKKEGLFRKHMMGKRVNYAARSVISPDPNIETNEIGIPPVFAKTLTYPEPVTPYNVKEMMQAVINGPEKWPGATHVQYEDQSLHSLANLSVESRIALANTLLSPQDSTATTSGTPYATRTQSINKKVFRHLRNGDMLLLNRQPTLHKPSIMAHKARVLPGEKTIRMHFAVSLRY